MAEASNASSRPAVYSIAPHRAFADALAGGLLRRHAGDPLALARGLGFQPTIATIHQAVREKLM